MQQYDGIKQDEDGMWRVKRLPRAYGRKRVGGRFDTAEKAVRAREAAMRIQGGAYVVDVEAQEWMNAPMGAYPIGNAVVSVDTGAAFAKFTEASALAASALDKLGINTKPMHATSIRPTTIKFGAIGDSHLCSNYERNDVLNHMYDVFAGEGITDVYHTGNYIDGEARFNFADIHTHGLDNQVKYFVANYPQRAGITTHFIAGDDHEGWYTQKNQIDIGAHTEDIAKRSGRTDLRYLGYMEKDIALLAGAIRLRVLHGGGGSAYSISHTSQKIVDGYRDEERPHVLLVGHYHKSEFLPNYRGVYIFQTGTTQEQTPFMRKKRLHADLGGWIISVTVGDNGGMRVSGEFLSYAPRKWEYR